MAKLNYKSITLEKLFDCKRGNSKYTKTYCNQHSGDYEVFTGTQLGILDLLILMIMTVKT